MTWTIVLDLGTWIVEQNQHGGLFLKPNFAPNVVHEPRSQFATIYDDGWVVYDFPETVPAWVKQKILAYGRQWAAQKGNNNG
jgi:hypothetical protein